MKWQTLETVRKAAEHSDKAALRASIVHWRQLCRATPTELQSGRLNEKSCALCVRFDSSDCDKCPVNTSGNQCTVITSIYNNAWRGWLDTNYTTLTTSPEWKYWQKASRAMLAVLEGLT